jgi:hypothetical protein
MEKTKEIVMTYFLTWQNKEWDKMRSCLSRDFKIDGGQIQFNSVDSFVEFCKNGPSWSHVVLLDSLFLENKAALLYEGITPVGEKIRVGEFLQLVNNKIIHSKVAISLA